VTAPTATCEACGSRQETAAPFCGGCGIYRGRAAQRPAENPRPRADTAVPAVPEREPRPTPAPAPIRGNRTDAITRVLAGVAAMQRLAAEQGRQDLAERLATTRDRVLGVTVPVVVVGEFKRGKSTLVNALLRRAVCPVDADVITAVPTVVRFGESPTATAFCSPDPEDDDGAPSRTQRLRWDDLADAVSDAGRVDGGPLPSLVEVQLPHPMLRSGMTLVDTPGVGGLDSAHGVLTLRALDGAHAALLVTDAAQELTAPEMQFLRMVLDRCPDTACVVTKTDLHAEWRRIVQLDRSHLDRAGLDLPIFGVSSLLRLQPDQSEDLLEESGFRPLVRFLAGRVTAGRAQAAHSAAADVRFVAAQLRQQVDGEQQVLARPQDSDRVLERLAGARTRTERLASPSAAWQQALTDRVQDLVTDVDHELHHRLRSIARNAEELIDRSDPRESWPDVEAWLRREVAAAVVATYDTMGARAVDVVRDVTEQFGMGAGTPADVTLAPPTGHADEVDSSIGSLRPAGRLTMALVAARSGTFLPMTLFAVGGHLPGLGLGLTGAMVTAVLAPISLALLGAIGWKVVHDERARQLAHRRQLAKAAARQYLDEVTFRISKDCRDALRHLQRRLRDEFQARAAALHRSSVATLGAAREATGLDPAQRGERARLLAERAAELRRLQRELSSAAEAGPQPAGVGRG
jgi:hypothetical protein